MSATLIIKHYEIDTEVADLFRDSNGWLEMVETLPRWLEERMHQDMMDPYEHIGEVLYSGERRRATHDVGEWTLTVEHH